MEVLRQLRKSFYGILKDNELEIPMSIGDLLEGRESGLFLASWERVTSRGVNEPTTLMHVDISNYNHASSILP